MTQEGVTELRNFLGRLQNLVSVLPELQKMADIDSAITEKKNLLKDLENKFSTAQKKVSDAEDKAKETLEKAESLLSEAAAQAVVNLKEANSKAGKIIADAKDQEATILARVKKIQENLAKLS